MSEDTCKLCGISFTNVKYLSEEVNRLRAELEVCHKHLKRATSDLSYCVAVPIDDYESSQALKQKALALMALLARGLTQMKLINGAEDKCLIGDIKKCANHQWIREVEVLQEALAVFRGDAGRDTPKEGR